MKISIGRIALAILLTGLSVLALNFNAFSQDLDTVTFSGKVTDSNGAPIAGASVSATLIKTGDERTVVSDENGRYKIVQLKPGIYTVKTSMNGFAIQEKTDLVTISAQNVQLDFSLAPAGVSAEQVITLGDEDTPLVDTTRTVVGGTVTEREVEELPNNSRNALDLVFTLGGTAEESLSTKDLAEDRNASVAPLEQGNFLTDFHNSRVRPSYFA